MLRLPRKISEERKASGDLSKGFVRDMIDGWRWVLQSATIVIGVALMLLLSFGVFGIHQAVSLHLVSSGTDALLISLVNVGSGVATMAGSVISAHLVDRIPAGRGILCALFFMACSQLPLVYSNAYAAIMVSSILLGLPMPLLSALALGFIFSKTPAELQGRARAAIMTTTMLFTSGTGAVAGTLLPAVGFRFMIVLLDALIVVAALLAWATPRIRTLPVTSEWEKVAL